MDPSNKRAIHPISDWPQFLKEGKKEFNHLYEVKSSKKYGKELFHFIKTLGKGAFGRVFLAKMSKTEDYYAIKVLIKEQIVKTKQIRNAMNEKKILQALNFPFCVYLEYAFQDNSYLYLCLPFVSGGEMFSHLQKLHRFQEPLARFYGAQVLLAFEYLHYCDMLFRDLKPENILIDNYGYLKITDFGFCKIVNRRTYTLCGTPDYLAPEIILNKGYGKSVDWWTYGVLLYEMNAGYPPFQSHDTMHMYEKVVHGSYSIPRYFSSHLSHLVENILQVDLSRRFGILKNGINDIKYHPWYRGMNWIALFNRKLKPPYVPSIRGAGDASNFDPLHETPLEVAKTDKYAKEFEDF